MKYLFGTFPAICFAVLILRASQTFLFFCFVSTPVRHIGRDNFCFPTRTNLHLDWWIFCTNFTQNLVNEGVTSCRPWLVICETLVWTALNDQMQISFVFLCAPPATVGVVNGNIHSGDTNRTPKHSWRWHFIHSSSDNDYCDSWDENL